MIVDWPFANLQDTSDTPLITAYMKDHDRGALRVVPETAGLQEIYSVSYYPIQPV